jgi:hypothetical protein
MNYAIMNSEGEMSQAFWTLAKAQRVCRVPSFVVVLHPDGTWTKLGEASTYEKPIDWTEEQPKRKRRTKAEMEAARLADA